MVSGWTSKPIKKLANIIGGGTPSTTVSKYWNGSIVWVVPTDITGQKNKYLSLSERRITEKGLANSAAVVLPKGTLLLCTRATIGELAIAAQPTATNQGFKNLVCFDDIDNEWLYYAIQPMKHKMIEQASGSTFLEISKTALGNIEIMTPLDKSEQRAIADALSDVDAYISALEKLIDKKRAVKQGAMQELLTGKRRLPGFIGEWVNLNLATSSTLKARIGWQGLTTAEYLDEGYAFLITGTDFKNGAVAWGDCYYVEKGRYDQDPNIQISNGDILITKDGTIGKVAIIKELSKKATLNSGVFVVRPKADAYDSVYVYYVLLSEIFKNFLAKLAAGSTIIHLYQKDFVNFEFLVPPTKKEQTAISEILSDIDAEIDALTAKSNKIKVIKQGMMNDLLTGKIRLMDTKPIKDATSSCAEQKCDSIYQASHQPTTKRHSQQFDDAVMIAGIVNVLYSEKFLLGRKKVQKCLYLLRRHQEASTEAFKKKAAGPYADEVRYKGGEPIAKNANYINTTTCKQGTTFARGKNIEQALGYIASWGKQGDIEWVAKKLKFKTADDLELLATVDMAICDLTEAGTPVTVASIKNLISTNAEWKAKLKKQVFSDSNIAIAIKELHILLKGGN